MSNFSTALNSFLTSVGNSPTILSGLGGLFGSLQTQVSSGSAAVQQAKALILPLQTAAATGNVTLITSLATSLISTAGMPADIQAMAELVIEKAATPQASQFIGLLATTIQNEAANNNSILSTLQAAQTKVTGG